MVSSVEIYDPRLNAWRMGDPMSSPRGYAAAVNLDGSVYLIGGLQSNVQILDTVSNDAVLLYSYLLPDNICAHLQMVTPLFSHRWKFTTRAPDGQFSDSAPLGRGPLHLPSSCSY